MAGDSKKFSAPEIVIMLIIAVLNDVLAIVADVSLAIPILGEILIVIAEITDFLVWGIILIWFGFKVGLFGRAGFAQLIGGATEFIGIPGRTVSAIIGIIMVNNPKASALATGITNPEAAAASKIIGGGPKIKA